jgi:hypothetical protein
MAAVSYPVVEVVWDDASHQEGPLPLDELRPLMRLRTVGYLLRRDDVSLTLAMEIGADGQFRDVSHIPVSGVVRVRKLK